MHVTSLTSQRGINLTLHEIMTYMVSRAQVQIPPDETREHKRAMFGSGSEVHYEKEETLLS